MQRQAIVIVLVLLSGCTTRPDARGVDLEPQEIPVLSKQPKIDGVLDDAVWNDALRWSGEFIIMGDPAMAGTFPLTLLVGSRDDVLLVGARVADLPPNPYSERGEVAPEWLDLLLSPDPDQLRVPADAIFGGNLRQFGSIWQDGFWNGSGWERQVGRANATPPAEGQPSGGRWASATHDGNDVTWEFYIPRTSPYVRCDGFQVQDAEPFSLRVRLLRQPPLNSAHTADAFSDYFPRGASATASPVAMDNWLRLAFPTVASTPLIVEPRPCHGAGY